MRSPTACMAPVEASLVGRSLYAGRRGRGLWSNAYAIPSDSKARPGHSRTKRRDRPCRPPCGSPARHRGGRGNRIVNTVPESAADCTVIVPPWPSTISRTMNRPSPRLVLERSWASELALGAWIGGSKIAGSASGGMGSPSLLTFNTTASSWPSALSLIGAHRTPCCAA